MKPIVCVITFALGTSTPVLISADADSAPGANGRKPAQEKTPTSQEQSNAPDDLKMSQSIRRALVKDRALSTSAKNVQVITIAGKVTLRGSVKTEEEKKKILEAAGQHAGPGNIADHIQINANP